MTQLVHSKLATLCLLLTLSLKLAAQTQELELSNMGKFKTVFSPISVTDSFVGSALIGTLTHKPKASYKVAVPFDVQQVLFKVGNGQKVQQGEIVATIDGVDVHHFIDELAAAKSIYLSSKKHFQATKNSANDRTLKSAEWLAINKNYAQAKLNYEHFAHLKKIIHVNENDSISILSPINGLINLANLTTDTLFEVVPQQSLQVKAYLPTKNINQLKALTVNDSNCTLQRDLIEPVIKNYRQAVWSKPSPDCQLTLGQQLVLTPSYVIQGFKVSQNSVFELDKQDYVTVKRANKLALIKVTIVGKEGNHFVIQSNQLSSQSQVLTSSVSIAQGIFMGLGE